MQKRQRCLLFTLILATSSFVVSVGFCEDPPATDRNHIRLGMSTALTGPTAFLGQQVKTGVSVAIQEVNRSGGINNASIELLCLDDGYEPKQTAPNMRRLIYDENVLAIIGNVGTPTAVAAVPIANAGQTAFFGAYTGAGILRKTPPDRFIINYRASYAEEVTAMIDALVTFAGLQPTEIAFFTQRDTYGDSGFAGGVAALKKHGLVDESYIVHGRYERNTLAVENGLADIMLSDPLPLAVIMVGTYAPCAEFIRLAKQYGLNAIFLNVSFVGTEALADTLGNRGSGVIITQVVPHFSADLPIIYQYRQAFETHHPNLPHSFSSLEGYIAARILIKSLQTQKETLTRSAVVDALLGMGKFDIGLGVPLKLDRKNHQACHRVWPTIIRVGEAVPFEWSDLTEMAPER